MEQKLLLMKKFIKENKNTKNINELNFIKKSKTLKKK